MKATRKGTDCRSGCLRGRVSEALRDWRDRNPLFATATPAAGDPTKYLQSLLERTEYIDIRGLQVGTGKAYRFLIEELYINLTTSFALGGMAEKPPNGPNTEWLRLRSMKRERGVGDDNRLPLHEALHYGALVIIGDPDSGKSTFLRRVVFILCQSLLGRDPEAAEKRLGLTAKPLPVLIRLVDLADYVSREAEGKRPGAPSTGHAAASLPHFLENVSSDENWGLERSFFEEHLCWGNALLLLDALDEVPARDDRESISGLIQSIKQAFSQCPMVITSRPAAYTGEVILPGFTHAVIDPLDDAGIETFLTRWSQALFPNSPIDVQRHRHELLGSLQCRSEIRRLARKYPWGEEHCDPDRVNYKASRIGHATPEGVYSAGATPEGLCDMAGNVWEWIADWYGKYEDSLMLNVQGRTNGAYRILRGGSWASRPEFCRCSGRRDFGLATLRVDDIGFRTARPLPSTL